MPDHQHGLCAGCPDWHSADCAGRTHVARATLPPFVRHRHQVFKKRRAARDIPLLPGLYISKQSKTYPYENRYVEIRVTDNGMGIKGSQLERIFDMFSQLSSEAVQEGTTGMGLSICR
ncbi:hypothetical protein GBK04_29035 [Cytophagaceae bacterium SJW1-29]|uniref:histidine kinase n=1 Tax=Salmonirosea aquatica TaxID=2654236 RepID=A0A7C9G062_9BACT|nr:hypothetical protein [Cytophagaceae bacterium SJW1-29]